MKETKDKEELAAKLHLVYQEELKRQGKESKYPDNFYKLPEDIKDLDRALARYVSFIIRQQKQKWQAETAEKIKKMRGIDKSVMEEILEIINAE